MNPRIRFSFEYRVPNIMHEYIYEIYTINYNVDENNVRPWPKLYD